MPYIFLEPSPLKLQEVAAQCMKPTGGGLNAKPGVAVPVLLSILHLMEKVPYSSFHEIYSTII